MTPPRAGDPVSFVVRHTPKSIIAHVNVLFDHTALGVDGFTWWTQTTPHVADDDYVRHDLEGITWIRGHYADDAPETAALLVAYTLWSRT